MELYDLKPPRGSRKTKKRVGRGEASGWGKTSGRGSKGQKSRSGGGAPPWFEGGQMPLQRRLPKRGFTNVFKKRVEIVNLGSLNVFNEGEELSSETLAARGLAAPGRPVKLLAKGELDRGLVLTVEAASAQAVAKVEGRGGRVIIRPFPQKKKKAEESGD
ncbi:MAG: 50S ribosomal protein L15 [Deltaproteobacteria bacterium]|jgi:large subunit ribosomal protein L15|nr:50S ribosomal protein L15 [Deltaproteobacteria bacterium]